MMDMTMERFVILVDALFLGVMLGAVANARRWPTWTPRLGTFAIGVLAGVACVLGGCGFSVDGDNGIVLTDAGAGTGPDARDVAPGEDSATAPTDAPPAPRRTLTQTAGRDITPNIGTGCNAPGGQTTRDGAWLRVFDVAGNFDVEAIGVGIASSTDAHAIEVRVGSYSNGGAPTGGELDMSRVTWRASATFDAGTHGASTYVEVPIVIGLTPSDHPIVGVFAASLQSVGDYHQGFTASAETAPGYFGSVACAKDPPATTASLGASGHVVLEIIGRDAT